VRHTPGVDVGLTELRLEKSGPRRLYRAGSLTNLEPGAGFGFAFRCAIFRVFWFAVPEVRVAIDGRPVAAEGIRLVIEGVERAVDELRTLDLVSFIGDPLAVVVRGETLAPGEEHVLEVAVIPAGDFVGPPAPELKLVEARDRPRPFPAAIERFLEEAAASPALHREIPEPNFEHGGVHA
jgi:hypothetical protein